VTAPFLSQIAPPLATPVIPDSPSALPLILVQLRFRVFEERMRIRTHSIFVLLALLTSTFAQSAPSRA